MEVGERRGGWSDRRVRAAVAVAAVLVVAVAAGLALWDALGVMGVPIDIVVAVILVRLLRPAFFPRVPTAAD
jgi:hypothetical protein